MPVSSAGFFMLPPFSETSKASLGYRRHTLLATTAVVPSVMPWDGRFAKVIGSERNALWALTAPDARMAFGESSSSWASACKAESCPAPEAVFSAWAFLPPFFEQPVNVSAVANASAVASEAAKESAAVEALRSL